MLAKKFKLADDLRIRHVLKEGRRITGRDLQLRYLPNNVPFSRFCVVTPKRFALSAVQRNAVRRRLYDAVRENFSLEQKKCYDVVVLCGKLSPSAAKDLTLCIKKIT